MVLGSYPDGRSTESALEVGPTKSVSRSGFRPGFSGDDECDLPTGRRFHFIVLVGDTAVA